MVPIIGDTESEYDETFLVELTNARISGSEMIKIIDDTATGTIENDDGTTITIAPASIPEGDDSATPEKMTFMVKGSSIFE